MTAEIDEQARHKLTQYLDRLPSQQAEHVVSSRARVNEVADTTAAARLRAASDEIDLERALAQRAVVVFSINADSYPGAGAVLGSLILQDLVGQGHGDEETRGLLGRTFKDLALASKEIHPSPIR